MLTPADVKALRELIEEAPQTEGPQFDDARYYEWARAVQFETERIYGIQSPEYKLANPDRMGVVYRNESQAGFKARMQREHVEDVRTRRSALQRLLRHASPSEGEVAAARVEALNATIDRLERSRRGEGTTVRAMVDDRGPDWLRRVFIARRKTQDATMAALLSGRLRDNGFEVVDGFEPELDSISSTILDRIGTCGFFVGIESQAGKIARDGWATSGWVVQESGAALARGCVVLLLVEEGVSDNQIGGLHGDVQRVYWTEENFSAQADVAVKMVTDKAAKLESGS